MASKFVSTEASVALATIDLRLSRLRKLLLYCSGMLCIISLALNILGISVMNGLLGGAGTKAGKAILHNLAPLFSVDTEFNIPTFYSVTLLIVAALCLYLASRRELRLPGAPLAIGGGWKLLSFVFVWLAFDEMTSFHELKLHLIRENLGIFMDMQSPANSIFSALPWYALLVPPGVVLLISLAPFLVALDVLTRKLLAFSAFVYLLGAVGIETAGILIMRSDENYAYNLVYHIFSSLEEFAEMAGVIFLISAVCSYIMRSYDGRILVKMQAH